MFYNSWTTSSPSALQSSKESPGRRLDEDLFAEMHAVALEDPDLPQSKKGTALLIVQILKQLILSIPACFGLRQAFWLIGNIAVLYLCCVGFPLALPDPNKSPKRQSRNSNTRALKQLWLEWMLAISLNPILFTSPLACPIFLQSPSRNHVNPVSKWVCRTSYHLRKNTSVWRSHVHTVGIQSEFFSGKTDVFPPFLFYTRGLTSKFLQV